MTPAAQKLQSLLKSPGILVMPCCFDALSARLIEQAGFPLTFMSGFAVSATRLALPDTGLISYGEMEAHGRDICQAASIPVIGDGDTGYGNAMNVKRTVHGYARAGFACIMIEDQLHPKRCGHTRGKEVVGRAEAVQRIRAASDARDEGAGILIMARTDARATHDLEEALWRARAFRDAGADITFLEAPHSRQEMETFCREVDGPKMANMLEHGRTPILSQKELAAMGFKIVAYPLTLLNTSVRAMQQALAALADDRPAERLVTFTELRDLAGFTTYYAEEERYRLKNGKGETH